MALVGIPQVGEYSLVGRLPSEVGLADCLLVAVVLLGLVEERVLGRVPGLGLGREPVLGLVAELGRGLGLGLGRVQVPAVAPGSGW